VDHYAAPANVRARGLSADAGHALATRQNGAVEAVPGVARAGHVTSHPGSRCARSAGSSAANSRAILSGSSLFPSWL
jgi:hypothetical protein